MPLHPQSKQFLEELARLDTPAWNEMSPTEARDIFSSRSEWFGQGPELHDVRDMNTPMGHPIRIYRGTAETDVPVMMYFHGGGWVFGDLDSHDAVCRNLAKESGLCVISVDYRRAPEFRYPTALDDCYDAVRFVVNDCELFGVNPAKILVAGDSAGGNLALATSLKAMREDGPQISGQLLLYPVLNRDFETESYKQYATGFGLTLETMQWFWDCYLSEMETDLFAAPLLADSFAGLRSTHVVLAECDVLFSEGEELIKRLHSDGVATTHQIYDGLLHGFMHFLGRFDAGLAAIKDVAAIAQRMVTSG